MAEATFRGPTTTRADNGCFDYFINFTIFIVLVTIECVRFSIFNTLISILTLVGW